MDTRVSASASAQIPYKFLTDPEDNPLVVKLKKLLDEIAGESIPSKLNKVLDVINGFANREKERIYFRSDRD